LTDLQTKYAALETKSIEQAKAAPTKKK
jgi:hypothetical protein